ncbi:MAG: hypothetical protein MUC43_00115 [Pirellula sp.]|jgi:hypothetical protein|nr:hypothetical protein [Pirellula sp.]
MRQSKYLQVLAAAVASGLSVRDASKTAGCTESTAYSLSCTQAFKDEVSRLKSEAVTQAVSVLTANATAASNALVRLLASDDEKVVLAAATKILGTLGPMQELAELRARIEAIEGQRLKVAR